ncbi:MAG: hypothetical protein WCG98_04415 [bacterium]
MRIKHTTRIRLINIFTIAETRIGNAVVSSTIEVESCDLVSIQLPMNGILVLSLTPQHTHGSVHFLHVPSTSVYQSLQVQYQTAFTWAFAFAGEQASHAF